MIYQAFGDNVVFLNPGLKFCFHYASLPLIAGPHFARLSRLDPGPAGQASLSAHLLQDHP